MMRTANPALNEKVFYQAKDLVKAHKSSAPEVAHRLRQAVEATIVFAIFRDFRRNTVSRGPHNPTSSDIRPP